MNAIEMQHSFDRKSGLGLDTYTVQKLLNQAQDLFIDRYIQDYDISEHARKKLITLVKNYSATPDATGATNISVNAVFVDLPSDLRRPLQEHVVDSSTIIKVKPIKYDEYNINKDDPFKKPDSDLVWRLDYGDTSLRHELITDGVVSIDTYKLRYIKNPTDIDIFANTSCILNTTDHEEIIDIAVSLIRPSTEN